MLKIRYNQIKNEANAKEMLEYVLQNDPILKPEGLPTTIEELQTEFGIVITEEKTEYYISLGPLSGEGHDFMFDINKITKKVGSVDVGEVISEPEDE
jgi:hypothetical protein